VLDVFGGHGLGHIIYYLVLLATILTFIPAATRPQRFPVPRELRCRTDKYLPRQLTKRGHFDSPFSNGIIVLGIVAAHLDHRPSTPV